MIKWLRKWAAWWCDGAAASLGPAFGLGGTGGALLAGSDPFCPSTRGEPEDGLAALPDIAEQCAAFLEGRYLQLMGRNRVKPAWVYINAVAHIDGDGLDRLARETSSDSEFGVGVSYLAEDLLLFCRRYEVAVGDLQRDVLVPLELELMGDGAGSLPDVTRTVEGRLTSYGKAQRAAARPGRCDDL